MYFTSPQLLAHEHPALFDLLGEFYRVSVPPPRPPIPGFF
jgi:Mlc titration factor MtfA (ptsG expression regulator)